MSNVDKRVVELELDSSNFNRDLKKTLGNLEKFKESLLFDDVSKSIEEVSVRFSALEIAAITVVSNITTSVMNLGTRLVKSLSTDNISSGWSKFEQKTKSVATMMSQTIKIAGKTIEGTSEKMEVITEQLDKLNWFTDQTSYSFTDMVDNIGKFTAAGQDLDASVEAMMGIANWAALSGQNATTASRAMYQLSQALSKGYVQLIDYKSIQNANMDTQEFRQTVLDTAEALGELTKQGENYITKSGSKFTKNQFTEQLSAKWFTSEVLTKSLSKYSAAVDQLYEISNETGLTAAQVIARYGDEVDVFGLKAFKAAQEARTFTDSLNAIKDAVSTGWMNTAEKIFGSYTDSKELWSDLADGLYDIFAASGDTRNQILSVWNSLEGRKDLFTHDPEHPENQGAFWNIFDAITALLGVVKSAFREIFPSSLFASSNEQVDDIGKKFKALTENVQKATINFKKYIQTNELLHYSLKTIFAAFKVVILSIKTIRYSLDPLITVVNNFVRNILSQVTRKISDISWLEKLMGSMVDKSREIYDQLAKLFDSIDADKSLNSLMMNLMAFVEFIKELRILSKIKDIFVEFVNAFKNSGGTFDNSRRILEGITIVIARVLNTVISTTKYIMKNTLPIIYQVSKVLAKLSGTILGGVFDLLANGLEALSRAGKKFKVSETFYDFVDYLEGIDFSSFVDGLSETIVACIKSIGTMAKAIVMLFNALVPIISSIITLFANIITFLSEKVTTLFEGTAINGGLISLIASLGIVFSIMAIQLMVLYTVSSKCLKLTESITYLLDAIQISIYSTAFEAIATSILEVALALALIGRIRPSNLMAATASLMAMSFTMSAMMMLIVSFNSSEKNLRRNVKSNLKILRVLVGFVLELSVALTLASLGGQQTVAASAALVGMIFSLVGVIAALSKINISASKLKNILISLACFESVINQILKLTAALIVISFFKPSTIISSELVLISTIFALMNMTYAITKLKITKPQLTKATAVITLMKRLINSLIFIAIPLAILAKYKPENLTTAGVVLTSVVYAMTGILYVLSKIKINKSQLTNISNTFKLFKSINLQIFALAVSMSLLSYAFGKFGSGKITNLVNNVLTCSLLMSAVAGLAFAAKVIPNDAGKIITRVALSAVIFSGAMIVFAKALSVMNQFDYMSFSAALLKMTLVCLGFAKMIAISYTISFTKVLSLMVFSAASTVFSLALIPFLNVLEKLGRMNYWVIIGAFFNLTNVMGVLSKFIRVSRKYVRPDKIAGLAVFAVAVTMFNFGVIPFIHMLETIASVNYFKIIGALVSLSTSLMAITIVAKVGAHLARPDNMIGLLSLTAVMTSILMIAAESAITVAILKTIDWKTLVSSLGKMVTMITMVGVIALLAHFIDPVGVALAAASLILLSSTLLIYGAAIAAFAFIPMEAIGKGLLLLGVSLAVLVATAVIVEKTGIATTILLLAASLVILGFGMTSLAMGIVAVSNAIPVIFESVLLSSELIFATIKAVIEGVIDVFMSLHDKITEFLIDLVKTAVDVFAALIDSFIGMQDKCVDLLVALTNVVLETIERTLPKLVIVLTKLAEATLDVFIKLTPKLYDLLAAIITGALETIRNNITTWTLMVADIIVLFLQALTMKIPDLVNALTAFVTDLTCSAMISLASNLGKIINASITLYLTIIKELGLAVKNRTKDYVATYIEFGKNIMEGLKLGIIEAVAQVIDEIPGCGKAIADKFRSVFGINSPSTVMAEMGMYLDQGLAKGIRDNIGETANQSADSMSKVIEAIGDRFDEDLSDELTITPVLDLSNVNSGVRDISSLMGSINGSSLSVSGSYASQASSEIARTRDGIAANQNGVTNTTNSNDNYYTTFNITTDDPEELARQTDIILQRNRMKASLAKGGV